MLNAYLPIVLVAAFVILNAVLMIGISYVLSSYRPTPIKRAPYESGMPVLGNARERYSVKFYLIAMLFIIFDIETVFLIPWGAAFRQMVPLRGVLLVEMGVFVAILLVGYVYVWKRGALQWE